MGKDKIFVIGCGNMGGAIISGLIKKGYNNTLITGIDIDEKRLVDLNQKFGINFSRDLSIIKEQKGTIILAVKPNYIKEVLNNIKEILNAKKHSIISVAAGIKIKTIEKILGYDIPIARCMPNINAMIGRSITAISFNKSVSENMKTEIKNIISSIGETVTIEESLFDAVTGLSGSGPAYVFLFIEALTEAGVFLGIQRDKALKLSLNTVLGSVEYLIKNNIHPAIAIDKVSSPGGTTVEGLHVLHEGKLKSTLVNAVKKAAEKSKIIGKNLE